MVGRPLVVTEADAQTQLELQAPQVAERALGGVTRRRIRPTTRRVEQPHRVPETPLFSFRMEKSMFEKSSYHFATLTMKTLLSAVV